MQPMNQQMWKHSIHGQYRSGGNPQMLRSANVASQEQMQTMQGMLYEMSEPEDSHLPREPRITLFLQNIGRHTLHSSRNRERQARCDLWQVLESQRSRLQIWR